MAIERHARTVSLLTMASRVTGLARDAVQSRVFGSGPVMGAFAFAFQVPNLFRRLFGEGALTASFVPVYARLQRDDPALARRYASTLLTLLALFLGVVTVVGVVVALMLPTGTESGRLGLRLLATMLPYMPIVCVVALMGALLGVHGRFGPAAFSPILLNLGIIVAALLVWWVPCTAPPCDTVRIGWVATGVLLAGVAQLGWMLHGLRGMGLRPMVDLASTRGQLAQTLRAALPMMVGLGVFQLNVFMDSMIACYPLFFGDTFLGRPFPLDEHANPVMNWATRLYEFPLGVFGISVATVIFPLLSRQADQPAQFAHSLRRGVRLSMFIGAPASLGLVLVGRPMASVVYEGGKCTPVDIQQIGEVLMAYAPAVVAYSVMQLFTRAFYALGDQRTPTRLSVAMVGLNFLLNVTLIWTPLGLTGLAWSTTICAFLQWWLLGRKLGARTGRFMDDATWASIGRTMVCTAVMGVVTYGAANALPFGEGWWNTLARLLALTVVGGGTMFLAAWRLRMPEWKWALGIAASDAQPDGGGAG
jgi:putative peptidoglycan lipid II flippase